MPQTYKLKFLSDFEFNNLPYKYLTKDDVGLADRKTKTAFVRKTGVPVMDQFVAAHEIEHLIDRYNDHDDLDGIAHKKGGAARNIVPWILSLIPGVGPILGAAANVGMNQYAQSQHPEQLGPPSIGSAVGQGLTGYFGGRALAGGLSGAVAGGTNAAAGFGSKAMGILGGMGQGALTGSSGLQLGTAKGATAASQMIGQSLTPGVGKSAAMAGASTPWSAAPASSALGFGAGLTMGKPIQGPATQAQNAATGATNLSQVPASTTLGMQGPVTQAQSLQGYTNLSQVPQGNVTPSLTSTTNAQNLGFNQPTQTPAMQTPASIGGGAGQQAGGALEQLGQQATRTPMLESILGADWRKTLLGAAIPAMGSFFTPGPQAFSPEQSQLFNDTVAMVKSGAQVQLTPAQQQAITANYDNELEQARQNLMDRFRYLRPNSDISNDTQMQQAMRELEADYAEKRANVLTSAQLGLSTQQTQMMGELANFDINTLAMKAGIQAQQAKEFKDMMSSLGYMVSGQTISQ